MSLLDIKQGSSPLVLGFPHTGTEVPADIALKLNDNGLKLSDTDWHIHTLYEDLAPDVTSVRTKIHRYVIDANRDPSGVSLYPGQNTTTLVPTTDFDGVAIWNNEPTPEDIEARRLAYHAPYHAALQAEIYRVKAIHGFAILYDCHSIRSDIPFLFEGILPDFNIGTNLGTTCAPSIEKAVVDICGAAEGYSSILNGRFKGGWTTRYYGQPEDGVHAIQMELAQSNYLATEAAPWDYDSAKAERLRNHLRTIVSTLIEWRP
ncbi:N-formylglutamate deformylase [Cohaesibacter sp. CAU 1516]|uniref:N-formylglutamate deformylase n=1 Tax=Cohaesibacter sp. CAU 1516 TaxID=2576038 RepID=UPI0010FDAEEF|nr:N-formylglutamate deformylase [Cohaesibacter sp. CAU 1516]TLP48738.1 N-formylglutamate deformylase [Cohaesibacter sp. CAU 1516]